MAEILSKIQEISEEIAAEHDAFVVDLNLKGDRHNQIVELFVDTDAGITVDGCAAISRDLSTRLDHENLIPHKYHLMVSSPGLDRPLKSLRQYRKNVGRPLKVRFRSPEEVKTISGRLLEVMETGIVLEKKGTGEEIPLAFENIEESKVEIDWGRESKPSQKF